MLSGPPVEKNSLSRSGLIPLSQLVTVGQQVPGDLGSVEWAVEKPVLLVHVCLAANPGVLGSQELVTELALLSVPDRLDVVSRKEAPLKISIEPQPLEQSLPLLARAHGLMSPLHNPRSVSVGVPAGVGNLFLDARLAMGLPTTTTL